MSFSASIRDHIGFSDLATFAKKIGDNCVFRFDLDQVELVMFTSGSVSTMGFITLETDALFTRYRVEEAINLQVHSRDLRQMTSAVKRCNFTKITLKERVGEKNERYLEFRSESTTVGGSTIEEVGELNVNLLTDREAVQIREPGKILPDVCLSLKPLCEYVNFVKRLSAKIPVITLAASANGEFRLEFSGSNVVAEHVDSGLSRPELDVEFTLPEDMDQLFKVRVRSKDLANVFSCEELDVTCTYVSIADNMQLVFFIFFNLQGTTQNYLTVHVPLFID